MIFSKRAVAYYAVTILLLFSTTASAAVPLSSEETQASSMTAALLEQSTQSAQNLVNALNASMALASSTTSGRSSSLRDYSVELNQLYGSSFSGGNPSTSYDYQVLAEITGAPGYSESGYVDWLLRTVDLYRALQADGSQRDAFNSKYGTYVPSYGSPSVQDREKLFWATAEWNPDPWYGVPAAPEPSYGGSSGGTASGSLFDHAPDLNLLYGSSFNGNGASTSYDQSVLSSITGASGYSESGFVLWLVRTVDLYKSLQADPTKLNEFNRTHGAYLPATGTPTAKDRELLFSLTAVWNNPPAPAPYTPPPSPVPTGTLFDYAVDLNLLYGASFNGSGPNTAYDRAVLTSITGAAGYNAGAYLQSLVKTVDLYRALQGNATQLANFNRVYGAYLPASGTPTDKDRKTLFGITSNTNYNFSNFWSQLSNGSMPAPTPAPTPPPTPTIPPSPAPIPPTLPGQTFEGTLFSPTSFWNAELADTQALSVKSQSLVNELLSQVQLAGPWINTTDYSTPLYVADSSTPREPVYIVKNGQLLDFTALNTETTQGVPIPTSAAAAGGTDGHITIYDTSTDTLYEFWQFQYVNGRWEASWGGILKNASTSDGIMPVVRNQFGGEEYYGATATSLPVAAGMMLLSELAEGVIPHALGFAIPSPKRGEFVWPAQRTDGWADWASAIPEGTRFRFDPNIYIDPSWPPIIQMMVIAVRDYGMVLRDIAGAVAFYGEDPSAYGISGDPYKAYYDGRELWDVMRDFPFDQLQALA